MKQCFAWFLLGVNYKYGTKLRYVALVVNTTLEGATLGYPKGLPIRDNWEEWLSKQVSNAHWHSSLYPSRQNTWNMCGIHEILFMLIPRVY